MKKLFKVAIVLVVMMFAVSCVSVALDPVEMEHCYSFEAPGKVKDELWVASNLWTTESYLNTSAVVEFSDKEAGVIKGYFITASGADGAEGLLDGSSFLIEVKDNSVRMTVSQDDVRSEQQEDLLMVWSYLVETLTAEVNSYVMNW